MLMLIIKNRSLPLLRESYITQNMKPHYSEGIFFENTFHKY